MPSPPTADTLWQNTNKELKNLFPEDVYEMWFSELVCTLESDSKLVLTTHSEFNAIWIENNFLDVISQQARSFAGTAIEVSIEVEQAAKTICPDRADANGSSNGLNSRDSRQSPDLRNNRPLTQAAPTHRTLINPTNTFENFVVGSGSQLAHAASIAVANAPGRAYNPLFVFGETGLGKTHLMHAVAHQMLVNNPKAKIAYVSTE